MSKTVLADINFRTENKAYTSVGDGEIATSALAGIVKPDGDTISVGLDGTITATGTTGGVNSINGEHGDVTLTQDDVGSGATYVRTENNFTDTLKSKLEGIESGAEVNVNSDWNSSSGDSQILNKPTLATVATSGSYSDLSGTPSIPSTTNDISEYPNKRYVTDAQRIILLHTSGTNTGDNEENSLYQGIRDFMTKDIEVGDDLSGKTIVMNWDLQYLDDTFETKIIECGSNNYVYFDGSYSGGGGYEEVSVYQTSKIETLFYNECGSITTHETYYTFPTDFGTVTAIDNTTNTYSYIKLLTRIIPETMDDIEDGTTYVKTHNDFTDTLETKLNGIEDGAEVNNISDTNATDLTDSGDSTLHYHSSDRDRANHTGTQTASTISDFDTEVSNNSSVTTNTAKVGVTTQISNVVEDTTPQLGGNLDTNGKNIDSVTPTELGYVHGVTSDIQTQLDSKSTFDGAYSSLTGTPTIPSTFDNLSDGTTNKAYTVTEKTKLAGIEDNANIYYWDGQSSVDNSNNITLFQTIYDDTKPVLIITTDGSVYYLLRLIAKSDSAMAFISDCIGTVGATGTSDTTLQSLYKSAAITLSSGTVTVVYALDDTTSNSSHFLATDTNYTTPSTPLYDSSPINKKFFDDNSYSLPTASTSVLGGVKVDGSTITISSGVISAATGGSGDVTGPTGATDNAVALFDGTSGKIIKDSTKTLPTGDIIGSNDTQTLTNKTIDASNNTISGLMSDLVNDTTPQLGGDLDLNSHNINGITPTEIGYLDNVSSNIQSQINTVATKRSYDLIHRDLLDKPIQYQDCHDLYIKIATFMLDGTYQRASMFLTTLDQYNGAYWLIRAQTESPTTDYSVSIKMLFGDDTPARMVAAQYMDGSTCMIDIWYAPSYYARGQVVVVSAAGAYDDTISATYAYYTYSNATAYASITGTIIDGDLFGEKTLYDNTTGTTSTVTLSETSANFKMLKIFYKTNDNEYLSVDVYDPNGKRINFNAQHDNGGTYNYIKFEAASISGTSITRGTASQWRLGTAPSISRSTGGYFLITRVVGYRSN